MRRVDVALHQQLPAGWRELLGVLVARSFAEPADVARCDLEDARPWRPGRVALHHDTLAIGQPAGRDVDRALLHAEDAPRVAAIGAHDVAVTIAAPGSLLIGVEEQPRAVRTPASAVRG